MSFFSKLFGSKEKDQPKIEERTVFNIQVGDIITYDLEDYQVVGTLTYNNQGYKWYAYQLQGDTSSLWLSAEMDDELELGIYKTVKEKLNKPIPQSVTVEGTKFHLDESGKALVSGTGRGSNLNGQQVEYYDFSDEKEEEFLSVEVWGNEIEVSKGFEIEEFEIKILAGSK